MHPMLNMALRAARAAGDVIVRAAERVDLLQVEQKGHNDFVTDVDRAAEAQIIKVLRKAYPDHAFIGEEGGSQHNSGKSDYEWIIDPLDGTTNFTRGLPHYAVSLACRHQGRIEHAVVYDPIRQEEFCASRGRGASLNGRRIRVSQRINLNDALLGTGIPFSGRCEPHIPMYMQSLERLAGQCAGIRRAGSAALDLAYVAAGRLDAYWEIGLSEWDIAAGALLVIEAGGLVSDFNGGNHYLETGNIVAGNPKCFKAVLQNVQPLLGRLDGRYSPHASVQDIEE